MSKTEITAEPGKQELTVTREFDAPRELVFKAYTDRDLYIQWLGPKGYKMDLEKFEPHDGGAWAYSHSDPDGNTYKFCGTFHEVLAPERIIQTFEFLGLPERGHVILETAKFEELPNGRTRMIGQSVFRSVEDRDGMIQSGMESGMNDSFEKLDEILKDLQQKNS